MIFVSNTANEPGERKQGLVRRWSGLLPIEVLYSVYSVYNAAFFWKLQTKTRLYISVRNIGFKTEQ